MARAAKNQAKQNLWNSATVHIRLSHDADVGMSMCDFTPAMMKDTRPWRTFRWYKGQRHYPGIYWSSTESDHVIYESRLELSQLLLADFDPSVSHIVAQPFLLKAKVAGRLRRHVPDYFLMTAAGPVVIDVKPRQHLDDPKVVATFAWAREVLETAGIRFEVASEQSPIYLENVRFLAGYRRTQGISDSALAELRALELSAISFAGALRRVTAPEPLARAALLHMLWHHELTADLSQVLHARTMLASGVAS